MHSLATLAALNEVFARDLSVQAKVRTQEAVNSVAVGDQFRDNDRRLLNGNRVLQVVAIEKPVKLGSGYGKATLQEVEPNGDLRRGKTKIRLDSLAASASFSKLLDGERRG